MQNVAGWPTSFAARMVALRWLDEATKAAARLDAGGDEEALHDFRVGVRRLRVALKAYRPWLKDTVSRTRRKKLRTVGKATGLGRDLQVQRAWLTSRAPESQAEAAARTDLLGLLDRAAEDAPRLDGTLRAFRKQAGRLRSELAEIRLLPPGSGDLPETGDATDLFGPTTASVASAQHDRVVRSLAAVRGPRDDDVIHSARIGVKRLRYLYQPFVSTIPACAAAYDTLGTLQDLLGDLRDVALLHRRIAEAGGRTREDRLTAGYLLLGWRASRVQLDLFGRLRCDWLNPAALDGPRAALRALAPCDATAGEAPG
jgi:CHAD domain-containing protein